MTWPLLLLPAGLGGSWWLAGWLARRRAQRAAYYLERECGWQLLPVFKLNWYWTADWYAKLPSYAAGRTLARYPLRTTRHPLYALKSVHISPYERDGVVSWMRAANHGLLYVCERPAASAPGGYRHD